MHRCGVGSYNTEDIHHHQWHYLCFISGFEHRRAAYAFEKLWHRNNSMALEPMQVLEMGKRLMPGFSVDLRMHVCLEFKPQQF